MAQITALLIALGFSAFTPVTHGGELGTLLVSAPDLPGQVNADGTGRDAETVASILEACGASVLFEVHPFGRHVKAYESSPRLDAVMTAPLNSQASGYSSEPYIHYHNALVYRSEQLPDVSSVGDLANLRIVTFRGGGELLNLDELPFGEIHEITDQRLHSRMLAMERVDGIVADPVIVASINETLAGEYDLVEKLGDLSFAPVFPPTPYKMVFKNHLHQQAFDRCLRSLQQTGALERIHQRHLSKL